MSSSSLFQQYFKTSMVAGNAKIIKILAGLAVVAFLNLYAGKHEFGLFMIAYSVTFVIAISIETFFQTLILYHTGREDQDKDMNSISILPASLYWGGGISVMAAAIVYCCAVPIERSLGHDGLIEWLQIMAFFIPAHVLLTLLTTAYRAKKNVMTMALYFDIYPSILLVGITVLIWGMDANMYLIGWAHSAAFLLPFAVLFYKAPLRCPAQLFSFTRWDIGYGLKTMAVYIANQPSLGLDILFVGQFCDAGTTAEYAMASRFARILAHLKTAISQLQIPRMGSFFKTGNMAALKKEFEALQDISLLATVIGCIVFVIFALPVMNLFGDYSQAYSMMLILCAASVIKAGFGSSGGYLCMAGNAGWLFITHCFAFVILVLSLLILVPVMGGIGAGYALSLHAFALMAFMGAVIMKKDNLFLMRGITGLYLAMTVIILALGTHQILNPAGMVSLFILISLLYFAAERRSIDFFRIPAR